MKLKGRKQDIGMVTIHRVNRTVTATGTPGEDVFIAGDDVEDPDKAFVISVLVEGKLRARTIGGETDTFDFMPGDDVTLYDRIYSHAENTILTVSLRY